MPNWCSNKLEILGSEQEIEQIEKLMLNDKGLLDFNVLTPLPKALYGVFNNNCNGVMAFYDENPDRLGRLNPSDFADKLHKLQGEYPAESFIKDDIKSLINDCAILHSDKPVEESIVEAVNTWRTLPQEAKDSMQYPLGEDTIKFMMDAMSAENKLHCKALCGYTDWYEWSLSHWGTKWNVHEDDHNRTRDDYGVTYSFDTAWGHPEQWFYALVEKVKEDMPENTAQFILKFAEGGMWFGGSLVSDEDGFIYEDDFTDEEICEFLGLDYSDMNNEDEDEDEEAEAEVDNKNT